MGRLIAQMDWTHSALGPIAEWPQSLKIAIRIMLSSRYAMWMAWGPELTFFCNDAYRPTLGRKEGWLGARSNSVWTEIWSDIGPRIDRVLASGEATWDEALLLFLERSGFREETYHTFSYSPLADDSGTITGMLCVVTEETQRVVGERRLRMLRNLGIALTDLRTEREVWEAVHRCIQADPKDIPFAVCYTSQPECEQDLTLAFEYGTGGNQELAPKKLRRGSGTSWPIPEATAHEVVVETLESRYGEIPCAPWDRPASQALLLPITAQGQTGISGTFVAGVNPHRPLDADYHGFLTLFVGQVSAALANVNAYAAEHARAEALAQLDQAKTIFFSNISHEFRTPLTLMIGPIEEALAATGPKEAEFRELLIVAHRNCRRLLRLVNSLLDFSRIEAGRIQATYRPTDLAQLTAGIAASFRAVIERAGIEFRVVCRSLGQPVWVDREMWETIVLNLLSNAFKFTFAGVIEVELGAGTDSVTLSVRDTGAGIPPEEMPRLFERFHRIEGAQGRSFEGSGIGLALIQELIVAHGGRISVTSEPERGSSFQVSLPFGHEHLPQDRLANDIEKDFTPVRAGAFVDEALHWLSGDSDEEIGRRDDADVGAVSPVPADLGAGAETILVADDNADLRNYIARLLRARGFIVQAVQTGLGALASLRERLPDLLITDVMMPELDGVGLVRAIREDDNIRQLPIIMLSARAGLESTVDGLEAGADDYLTKPFSARELLARVRACLTTAKMRREASETMRAAQAELQRVNETLELRVVERTSERDRLWRNSRDLLLVLDMSGVFRAASPAWQTVLGWDPEALVGRFHLDLIHPDDRSASERALAIASERALSVFENRFLHKDGGYRWISWVASPDQGLIYASGRHITAEKEAMQAVQRSEARMRAIFETSYQLQALLSPDGTLLDANTTSLAVIGASRADVVGKPFWETPWFTATRTLPDLIERAVRRAAHGESQRREIAIDLPDGVRHFDFSLRPVFEATGQVVALLPEAVDITERRMTEEKLRQAQKIEALGQLTGGVAHDFNNLLMVLSGGLQLIGRGVDGVKRQRILDGMNQAVIRGAGLCRQLLAFSRRQALRPEVLNLSQRIGAMRELLERSLRGDITVRTHFSEDLWHVEVDPGELELVVLNLAVNARDAMPRGGEIVISAHNEIAVVEGEFRGDFVCLQIRDSGIGMSSEVMSHAFEPFFTTKDIGKGSGLGLAQTHGFVRASGGFVRIDSQIGVGTTIALFLPRSTKRLDRRERTGGEHLHRLGTSGGGATVLLVEDDEEVANLTGDMLRELGFEVTRVASAEAAIAALGDDHRIDVVFSDIMMPGAMNGIMLAHEIKRRQPNLPVLLATGYTGATSLAGGNLHFKVLRKPYRIEELAAALARVQEVHEHSGA